ncbi:TPA: hypothetical protein U5D81_001523 [Yersinia enterocolitica]|nr:hypothetical protein [Yersinia enterocolitica]HEN3367467.1 hypothetical protein [Yersinia enterocolitica]HEN3400494.1 hypothetical protein [Yersinia enterocolitica]HEN3422609.1 hypothetical protein [Yersinia enterocolitica]
MELLSSKLAAEHIHTALPGNSVKYWLQWLTNNRNQSRRAFYRIPFHNIIGMRSAHYDPEEINKFVEFEKKRQLGSIELKGRAAEVLRAYGIGEKNGGITGRKWVANIMPQVDELTKVPYIQILLDDPLLVFRLDIEQAEMLSNELIEILKFCNRIKRDDTK